MTDRERAEWRSKRNPDGPQLNPAHPFPHVAPVLGWPAIGLLRLSAGYGSVVEWSMPVLIGVTLGLAMRWMTDRAG